MRSEVQVFLGPQLTHLGEHPETRPELGEQPMPRSRFESRPAAIELATARAFGVTSGFAWEPTEIAGLCQRAENVSGSQSLYGEDALRQVEEQSTRIVRELDGSSTIPLSVISKPVLTTPDAMRGCDTTGARHRSPRKSSS